MSQMSDGHAVVYNKVTRLARKEHCCCACRETIRKGDRYTHVSVIDDGYVDTYKRCLRCEAMHAHLNQKMADAGERYEFPDEALDCGHTYEERWETPPPPELVALAFMTPDEAQAQLNNAPDGAEMRRT